MRRLHPSPAHCRAGRLVLILGALILLTSVALAQSGDGYDLSWASVDGGGGTLSGTGGYTLSGTAGQPDTQALSGDSYTLYGGFWGGMRPAAWHSVYLPIVMRDY